MRAKITSSRCKSWRKGDSYIADRTFSDVQSLGKNLKVIVGSFAPNGSSAVAAASNRGIGWSVARTSAGLFTITLQDVFPSIVHVSATLQQATAGDQFVQVGAISASARTIEIRVWDVSGAAVADVAVDANNRINFVVIAKNSTVSPG